LPYSKIQAWSVETAGRFDLDAANAIPREAPVTIALAL
jgi:hypothetical protein